MRLQEMKSGGKGRRRERGEVGEKEDGGRVGESAGKKRE